MRKNWFSHAIPADVNMKHTHSSPSTNAKSALQHTHPMHADVPNDLVLIAEACSFTYEHHMCTRTSLHRDLISDLFLCLCGKMERLLQGFAGKSTLCPSLICPLCAGHEADYIIKNFQCSPSAQTQTHASFIRN